MIMAFAFSLEVASPLFTNNTSSLSFINPTFLFL